MFKEAADDRLDADVLGQAGHLRPQAADAAHHQFDLDAGIAGLIERIDDFRIDQRIHLHPDRTPAAAASACAISSWMCSRMRGRKVSGDTPSSCPLGSP
jgi:hypothetical protein